MMLLVGQSMSRNIVMSALLLALLCTLPAVLFAAADPNRDVISNPQLEPLDIEPQVVAAPGNKAILSSQVSALGFRSTAQIGSTWNDMQQNGSMGRQIVVGGGWVHNIWNFLPAASTANRNSSYFAYDLSSAATASNAGVDPTTGGAGFASIGYDATSGGRAAVFVCQRHETVEAAARVVEGQLE